MDHNTQEWRPQGWRSYKWHEQAALYAIAVVCAGYLALVYLGIGASIVNTLRAWL